MSGRRSPIPVSAVDCGAIREAALVVTAAARMGAATLYSEEMNHGQVIAGVRIVNPFR